MNSGAPSSAGKVCFIVLLESYFLYKDKKMECLRWPAGELVERRTIKQHPKIFLLDFQIQLWGL